MGKESTRVAKALIDSHPDKELIQRYLKQQSEIFGDEFFMNITKKDFLVVGLLDFFPSIKRRE
jgi:hypothetical protein